jgi:hypothetical protein
MLRVTQVEVQVVYPKVLGEARERLLGDLGKVLPQQADQGRLDL